MWGRAQEIGDTHVQMYIEPRKLLHRCVYIGINNFMHVLVHCTASSAFKNTGYSEK